MKVKLIQGSTIYEDVLIFNKFEDAKKTALARNPTASVVPMNPVSGLAMDWNAAQAHCKEKNWKWTLNLIDKYQKEMEELKDENVKLKRQLVLRSRLNK